jgi:predicted solute-binding protein
MSASLKKSMEDAWQHPDNLGELKGMMKRFKAQQEKQIMEQKAMEREMRDAESSIAATMEQVVLNSDDEVPDEVIAAFKEDWKRKRQQGTMSKFKATSVNRNNCLR